MFEHVHIDDPLFFAHLAHRPLIGPTQAVAALLIGVEYRAAKLARPSPSGMRDVRPPPFAVLAMSRVHRAAARIEYRLAVLIEKINRH
jgi:hypothetical protein